MRRRILIGVAVVLAIGAVGVFRWSRSVVQQTAAARSGERVVPAGCDPRPIPPPLPHDLTPRAPTLDGVIQALDASLGPTHKAFLRCFSDEDDLVAHVHLGMGRWLRGTLHLFSSNALTANLRAAGAKNPDDMSSMILRAYFRVLRGLPPTSSKGTR